jgi:hypothetical protein
MVMSLVCMIKHSAIKAYGLEVYIHAFLTCVPKEVNGTRSIVDCMGFRLGLGAVQKRKISGTYRWYELRVFSRPTPGVVGTPTSNGRGKMTRGAHFGAPDVEESLILKCICEKDQDTRVFLIIYFT